MILTLKWDEREPSTIYPSSLSTSFLISATYNINRAPQLNQKQQLDLLQEKQTTIRPPTSLNNEVNIVTYCPAIHAFSETKNYSCNTHISHDL